MSAPEPAGRTRRDGYVTAGDPPSPPLYRARGQAAENRVGSRPAVATRIYLVRRSRAIALLAKRAMDVVLAVPLLILSLPVLAISALLVKVTSPGPAFFLHTRKGKGEEDFQLIKLRTMVEDAESLEPELESRTNGGIFEKVRDDPRVTPVGRVLRKTSIDELPQLVNVLRGEMSLVGPRPISDDELRRLPPGHRSGRARYKPGLTGLWQINGRSECSDRERLAWDQRYVEQWSLALDLEILLHTPAAVITARGAE